MIENVKSLYRLNTILKRKHAVLHECSLRYEHSFLSMTLFTLQFHVK